MFLLLYLYYFTIALHIAIFKYQRVWSFFCNKETQMLKIYLFILTSKCLLKKVKSVNLQLFFIAQQH